MSHKKTLQPAAEPNKLKRARQPEKPTPPLLSKSEIAIIASEHAQHVSTGGCGYEMHNAKVVAGAIEEALQKVQDDIDRVTRIKAGITERAIARARKESAK